MSIKDDFITTANFFKAVIRSYAPQPVTWDNLFPSRTQLSGVSVSEYSALHYSPVWCGVSTLSTDIAKLPLVLYKNLNGRGKERFTTHPLYRVLHDRPNPEMTSVKFRQTMQALCLLYGNAYAEIVRDQGNRVAGLYPVLPSRVAPFREDTNGQLRYRVTNSNGKQVIIRPENMIHLSSISLDGIIGESIVTHASESIGLGIATERFGAAFFGNGSTFGGVLEVPGDMKQVAKDNTRNLIEAVHQGVERAHKVLVVSNGAKFTSRGTAPNEGQFNETRKFQINETARWLGMPPHKLGDLENAHFTNIEEQEIQYYVGCVSGWLKVWEQELASKLIPSLEYSQQSIEHVLEGVLRGDSTKRSEYYDRMVKLGAFSLNDVLRLENMNTIGPAGDQHFVALNMVPVERYSEYFEKKLLPTPATPDNALPPAPPDPKASRALDDLMAAVNGLITRENERDGTLEQRAAEAVAAHAKAVQDADALRAQHEEQATVWKAKCDDAQRETTEERTAREDSERRLAEERTARTAAEAAREQGVRDAESQAERVRQAESRVQEAEARVVATASESAEAKAAARAEVEAAQIALREGQAAHAQATADLAGATERAAVLASKATELETSLQQRKATELDRLTRVVAAHRTLIVHAVQRLLRPEVDRARRRQATPDSLRKWVDAFYVTHRDVCADELYPAVLTHLAWKRSEDDPREVARTLAEAHCAQSERELRAVIDASDLDEFHGVLERLLGRWEQERPHIVADGVLHDEVVYIRSIQ